jgi:hypothetical protein
MPISRYNKPAQQALLNTYTPLPYQELLQGLGAKEKQQELGLAGVGQYGDKEFQYLQADRAQALQAQNWLDTESDRLAGTDLTTPEGKKSLREFERQGKKLFGQEGAVGSMQANFNAYQAATKRERERLKKGDITQDQFQKTMSGLLSAYEGIGEQGIEGYRSIDIEDIAASVNFTDWANKYGKDFEAALDERAYAKTDGLYISEGKRADEVLSSEEIANVLTDFAQGDDVLQNYLRQGQKYGYTSIDNLVSAVRGASNKFDVQKHTETAGLKTDAYGLDAVKRQRDQKEEMDKLGASLLMANSTMKLGGGDSDALTYDQMQKNKTDGIKEIATLDNDIKALTAHYQDYFDANGNILYDLDADKDKLDVNTLSALRTIEDKKSSLKMAESEQLGYNREEFDIFRSQVPNKGEFDTFFANVDKILDEHRPDMTDSERQVIKNQALLDNGTILPYLNELSGGTLYNSTYDLDFTATSLEDFNNTVKGYSDAHYKEENVTGRTVQRISVNDDVSKALNLGIVMDDIFNNQGQWKFTSPRTGKEEAVTSGDSNYLKNNWPLSTITSLVGSEGGSFEVTPMKEINESQIVYDEDGNPTLDKDEKIIVKNGVKMVVGPTMVVNSNEVDAAQFVHKNLVAKNGGAPLSGAALDAVATWSQSSLMKNLEKELDVNGITDGRANTNPIRIGGDNSDIYIKVHREVGSDTVDLIETDKHGNKKGTISGSQGIPVDNVKHSIMLMSYKLKNQ